MAMHGLDWVMATSITEQFRSLVLYNRFVGGLLIFIHTPSIPLALAFAAVLFIA